MLDKNTHIRFVEQPPKKVKIFRNQLIGNPN